MQKLSNFRKYNKFGQVNKIARNSIKKCITLENITNLAKTTKR